MVCVPAKREVLKMKINNLEELREIINEETIKRIVTEYMMENIARNDALLRLEDFIENKNDTDKVTIREIKNILEGD